MRVVALAVLQPHLLQQAAAFLRDLLKNLLFVCLVIGALLCQKLLGERHVLQHRILREQVE